MNRFIIIFLIIFISQGANEAKSDKLLDLLSDTYEILVDADEKLVRIPIKIEPNAQIDNIRFFILDVAVDDRHDPALLEAFQIRPDDKHTALWLSANIKPVMVPGKYAIQLGIENNDGLKQIEKITLKVPAAKIKQPESLIVHNVKWPWSKGTVEGAYISIIETSRRSRITNLSVSQLGIDHPQAEPNEFKLKFADADNIPPGGRAQLNGELIGPFPLGSIKGKLSLSAPELEDQLEVPFEVKTRYYKGMLLAILVSGLILGYITRIKLQATITLNTFRLEALELIEQIVSAKQNYPDTKFKNILDGLKSNLDNALKSKDTAKLKESISTASETFAKEIDALIKLRDSVQSEINGLRITLTRSWSLPNLIQQKLKDSNEELVKIQTDHLNQGNPTRAKEETDNINKILKKSLSDLSHEWINRLKNWISEIKAGGLPEANRDLPKEFSSQADVIETKATDFFNEEPKLNIEELLEKIHLLYVGAKRLIELSLQPLKDIPFSVIQIIEDYADVSSIKKPLSDLDKQIQESGPQPENYLFEQILKASKTIGNSIESIIRDKNTDPSIKALLDQGRFEEAAQKTVEHLKSKEEDRVLGDEKTSIPQKRFDMALFTSWPIEMPKRAEFVSSPSFHVKEPPAINLMRLESRELLNSAKFFQFLLSGVGIALLGYFMFSDNFVGTGKDILTAFLWAYTIDIGVDIFVELAKKWKPS